MTTSKRWGNPRLFLRSRQTARHGIVTEHDEPVEAWGEEA
jgi:hypothetical protein